MKHLREPTYDILQGKISPQQVSQLYPGPRRWQRSWMGALARTYSDVPQTFYLDAYANRKLEKKRW